MYWETVLVLGLLNNFHVGNWHLKQSFTMDRWTITVMPHCTHLAVQVILLKVTMVNKWNCTRLIHQRYTPA